jgi:hypothetical protein
MQEMWRDRAGAGVKPPTGEIAAPPIRFSCGICGKSLRAPAKSAGKKVKCPYCRRPTLAPPPKPTEDEAIPVAELASVDQARAAPARFRVMSWIAVLGVAIVVIGCSVYANLSFAVTNRANYKFFPPFKPFVNQNGNRGLGGEYFSIAKALVKGRGFADPFREETGPTAWMPPVLPFLLAALLWLFDNNVDAVMTVCLVLHGAVLVATGLMVLALAWQTTRRLTILIAAAIFLTALINNFRIWYQQTHDMSIVLLALDIVVAGFAWGKPLHNWKRAACWGLAGGFCAMISPIVGMTWVVLTIAHAIPSRAWLPLSVAALFAALAVAPWTARNYLIFGRLIPVKSNAAYELWQSQCKQKDGLLHHFNGHPFGSPGPERQLHKKLGEMEFIDQKRELFWAAVMADPLDFADRVAARFLVATVWYEPFSPNEKTARPVVLWLSRAWHPLPFLALVFLATTAIIRPLHWTQWMVIGAYLLYIGPYIAMSYYERYEVPLLAIKALLITWAADRLLCFLWPPHRTGVHHAPHSD